MKQKELSLTVYNGELPEIAKVFLVCKKIEGLSEQTLDQYMRLLQIFFREIPKPIEQIGTNDIRIFCSSTSKIEGCPIEASISTDQTLEVSFHGQQMKGT